MVTDSIDQRVAKIRALEQLATLGPWEREQDSSIVNGRIIYLRADAIHPAVVAVLTEGQYHSFEQAADDFAFIAGMREHVPWLLDMVDNVLPSLVAKNLEIDRLNLRVRELEMNKEMKTRKPREQEMNEKKFDC